MSAKSVQEQVLTIYRGQRWAQPFLPDPDETDTDLTGADLVLTIRDTTAARAMPFRLTEGSGITTTSAAAGQYTAVLEPADTATLTRERYKFDVWRRDVKRRIAGGTIEVRTPEGP